ncbi:MAG: sigma-54-dependent Fis family transcriptional regulator [Candidatus Delongbacteria bacterium]|nr:sigma-54-dependent Fis family transcriptional regulator [Candidatus Delongbacteria bacterium]MBN2837011.1 sigma-54-dependent Fis family transcriptional regulator [Candidatus Delongbacteria bacterium]
MKNKITILIVDDETEILKSLGRILEGEGYLTFLAKSGKEALQILEQHEIHIVLCDIKLDDIDGIDLLKIIRSRFSHIQTIMLTGYGTIESSIDAIKNGAFGYLLKPFNIDEIFNEIHKIRKLLDLEMENKMYRQKEDEEYIVYHSRNPKMRNVIELVKEKIARADSTILLTGESGTGKEIVASLIHKLSRRSNMPFIKVSCAALSEGILESELFGHVKGAFTGALKDKIGRFEAAQGGTIFLDEIGDFSPLIQLKMLRVLQEKTIEKVGDNNPVKINCRVIAATNKNLDILVKEGTFREDLYYRINVINLELPPLRDRKEDIPVLIENFIRKYSKRNNLNISHIEEKALEVLMEYNWTGNIRELENTIERSVVLSENGIIGYNNLSEKIVPEHNEPEEEKPLSLKQARETFEKKFIASSIIRNNKNISKTADELGLARKNLYEKLKKYNITI